MKAFESGLGYTLLNFCRYPMCGSYKSRKKLNLYHICKKKYFQPTSADGCIIYQAVGPELP